MEDSANLRLKDLFRLAWPQVVVIVSGFAAVLYRHDIAFATFQKSTEALERAAENQRETNREVGHTLKTVQESANANAQAVEAITEELRQHSAILREHDLDISALKERTKGDGGN